jgi:DNA-binding MarR family transcriptional regulator
MQGYCPDGAALVAQLGPLFSTLTRVGERSPLTSTQRLLLIELVDTGPQRLGALADAIGATDPTASRAVDGLVAAGLVERGPDPDDRRAVIHRATAKGKAWAKRRRTEITAALDEALEAFTPAERDELLTLITRLNAGLRPADLALPAAS